MIDSKIKPMVKIIMYCRQKGYEHTAAYLEDAKSDRFTAIQKRLKGKTSGKVERVMRTVNMRAKVSKWSEAEALKVTKIRLAYCYNGFDA